MSNIIKRSVKTDEVVNISNPPFSFPVLEKEKSEDRFKHTLNFKDSISSAIDGWHRKIKGELSSIEESTGEKIEKAFQNGYEKGFNDGLEKEHADRDDYLNEFFSKKFKIIETLLSETRKKNERAFQGLEEKIIHLAIHTAEVLIQKNLKADSTIILSIITEAMSHLISSETINLKVSGDDYKIVKEQYDRWLNMAGNVKEFEIEIDKRLVSGDCLIETEGGIIDATMTSRLEVLAEELLKASK